MIRNSDHGSDTRHRETYSGNGGFPLCYNPAYGLGQGTQLPSQPTTRLLNSAQH